MPGIQRAHLLDAGREVRGPAIPQVVTIDRSNHDVTQFHVLHGARQLPRLGRVRRQRPAVRHVAERATAGAHFAQDHERRRAF